MCDGQRKKPSDQGGIAPSVRLARRDGKVHRGQDRETEGGRERVNKDRIRSGLKAMVKARRDIRAGNTDMFGTMVRTKDEEKEKVTVARKLRRRTKRDECSNAEKGRK